MQEQNRAAQIAWAAGLYEGEGSALVTVMRKRRAGEVREYLRPTVVISMTDRDVLERFAAIVGAGRVFPVAAATNSTKPVYRWHVAGARHVIPILESFLPWLGERRAARAREVLAAARTIRPNGKDHCMHGHEFSGENLRWVKNGKYMKRVCRACERERARKRLGIKPENYRVTEPSKGDTQ